MVSVRVWQQRTDAECWQDAAHRAVKSSPLRIELSRSVPLVVLQRRADFVAAAKDGRNSATPGLVLQSRKNVSLEKPPTLRYGLTASAKIGNAVIRNRARRRLRALANSLLPRHATIGYDYVIIARVGTLKRSPLELEGDLKTALRKLGLWHE